MSCEFLDEKIAQIPLRRRHHKILIGLLTVNFSLVAIYVLTDFAGSVYVKPFDLDAEINIPTWWSSSQLLCAGIAFGIVALRNSRVTRTAYPLAFLAATLVAMSIDETASLHENFGFVVDNLVRSRSETVFDRTGLWFAVVGLPFAFFVCVLLFAAYRSLEVVPQTAARFALGMGVLLLGAVFIEALTNFFGKGYAYHLAVCLEEGLEMSGGSILLWAGIVFLVEHSSMTELVRTHVPLISEAVSNPQAGSRSD